MRFPSMIALTCRTWPKLRKRLLRSDGLDASRYDKFLFRLPSDAQLHLELLSDFGVNEVRGLISGVNTWYTFTDCLTLANGVGVSFGLRRAHQCTAPPYVTGGYGPRPVKGRFRRSDSPDGRWLRAFECPRIGCAGVHQRVQYARRHEQRNVRARSDRSEMLRGRKSSASRPTPT